MRSLYFVLFLILIATRLPAQYFEVGYKIGGSNYLGDLTPSRFFTSVGETGLFTGVYGQYNVNNKYMFLAGLNFGSISAKDVFSVSLDGFRQGRNLSFRSNIVEMEFRVQSFLVPYRPKNLKSRFSPYAFIGIGIFKFNPQAYYEGQWYDLQPLGTEGQGLPGYDEKYPLIQPSIPLGFGFKYAISENLNLSFELGTRKTFTDYLDDTSRKYPDLDELARENGEMARILSWRTDELNPNAKPPAEGTGRGDPGDLDWYIFTGFSLSYNFIPKRVYHKPRWRKKGKVKCPKPKGKGIIGNFLIRN